MGVSWRSRKLKNNSQCPQIRGRGARMELRSIAKFEEETSLFDELSKLTNDASARNSKMTERGSNGNLLQLSHVTMNFKFDLHF